MLDLNYHIHETMCDLLDIENNAFFTNDFENTTIESINLREAISPKNRLLNQHFQTEPYTQVFSEKFDFVTNLSILDLLFNEGPNSYTILERSNFNFRDQ